MWWPNQRRGLWKLTDFWRRTTYGVVLLGQVTDQIMPKWVRSLPSELLLDVRATSLSDFERIYLNWQLADNYNADGNGNVKKAVSLISNTTTLHVHHDFLFIFFPSLHNYNVKWRNFELTWDRERQGDQLYYLSGWTRTRSPLFSSKLTSLLSSNWVTLYKGKKVSKDAKSIFQRRFHWRRCCQMVRSLVIIRQRGKKSLKKWLRDLWTLLELNS